MNALMHLVDYQNSSLAWAYADRPSTERWQGMPQHFRLVFCPALQTNDVTLSDEVTARALRLMHQSLFHRTRCRPFLLLCLDNCLRSDDRGDGVGYDYRDVRLQKRKQTLSAA